MDLLRDCTFGVEVGVHLANLQRRGSTLDKVAQTILLLILTAGAAKKPRKELLICHWLKIRC